MSRKKSTQIKKEYYLFNSENFILGRMSSEIAFLLQGKNNSQYTPNKTEGCFVIVINSDKINVSGRKLSNKMYHSFSGYPGGISSQSLEQALKKDSRQVIWNSVYGMLPKNKLRDKMMKRLLIFKDDKHNIQGARIKEIKPSSA
jgi:large subunit ribosomal protein L13